MSVFIDAALLPKKNKVFVENKGAFFMFFSLSLRLLCQILSKAFEARLIVMSVLNLLTGLMFTRDSIFCQDDCSLYFGNDTLGLVSSEWLNMYYLQNINSATDVCVPMLPLNSICLFLEYLLVSK